MSDRHYFMETDAFSFPPDLLEMPYVPSYNSGGTTEWQIGPPVFLTSWQMAIAMLTGHIPASVRTAISKTPSNLKIPNTAEGQIE